MLKTVFAMICVASHVGLRQEAEVDIDALCPPRPETAAKFKAGTYPPAARSYGEAAKKSFAYMTSLPAMRTLVETGVPEQTYQHNAYVSKTHAAHILQMLRYAQCFPEKRDEALRFAKASADYLLTQLESSGAPLAYWPPTYGRTPLDATIGQGAVKRMAMVGNEPEGAVKYRGEVMLLYPADVGRAFVDYYAETKDERFLTAAIGIANTYLKTRRADGSWPLKMKLATGEPIGENTLVPTRPLAFFNALYHQTGDAKWNSASDACFAWLDKHPLSDWNWDGQFEDIKPEKPYMNPTKHNAVETMFEILRRYPNDPVRIKQCQKILKFCEDRFVCWEKPRGQPLWDTPSVLEQYSCFFPIDASAAKMIRGYLALWRVTKDPELLAKARALGDTLTRVQEDSGRIPTFWTHDSLGELTYDWLNCMGAGAMALLELSEVDSSDDAERHGSGMMNVEEASSAQAVAGGVKVLFIGNSITLHGSLPEIGWTNVWGMAASAAEKDYRNIVFDDCDLIHNCGGALSVHLGGPGTVEDVLYRNIRIEYDAANSLPVLQTEREMKYGGKAPWSGDYIRIENEPMFKPSSLYVGAPGYDYPAPCPIGTFREICFENVSVTVEEGAMRPGVHIQAEPGSSFGRIKFQNVTINGVEQSLVL